MDWQALHDGIRAWFAARSGIVIDDVLWRGEPEGMRGRPCAYLSWLSQGVPGMTDEVLFATQGADKDALVELRGVRQMTLSCLVQTRDQTPVGRAYPLLERVRDSLFLPSAQAVFAALGIGLIGSASLVELNRVFDRREESQASLDVRFSYVVDNAGVESIGTIEHVQVGGAVQAGEAISIPDRVIP